MFKSVSVLDVVIDNLSLVEAAKLIARKAGDKASLTEFCFVNADCLNIAFENKEYRKLLSEVDFVFGDGSGVRYACKLTGQKIADNINGTDLFPLLCEYSIQNDQSIYFLGGEPGIAEKAAIRSKRRYPKLRIAGHHSGYFLDDGEIIQKINSAVPDILLVAMGAPEQEMWIHKHKNELSVGVAIGVGGLFDFIAHKVGRAPGWIRLLGFEWLIRLLNEPRRLLHRYLIGNPIFLYRVLTNSSENSCTEECVSTISDFRLDGSSFDLWQNFEILEDIQKKYLYSKNSIISRKIRHFRLTRTYQLVKRILDVGISTFCLIALSPVMLLTSIMIYIDDPGPIFFHQKRVGLLGKLFSIYKFRSMNIAAETSQLMLHDQNESSQGVLFKIKKDPRITRVGAFIRKYSIDELPQFVNVLKGEMSLVGPRPPLPCEVKKYTLSQRRRLEVKPGITCIWQVSGRSNVGFTDQVNLDLRYIDNQSVSQDLNLLFRTLPAVLFAKGAY